MSQHWMKSTLVYTKSIRFIYLIPSYTHLLQNLVHTSFISPGSELYQLTSSVIQSDILYEHSMNIYRLLLYFGAWQYTSYKDLLSKSILRKWRSREWQKRVECDVPDPERGKKSLEYCKLKIHYSLRTTISFLFLRESCIKHTSCLHSVTGKVLACNIPHS
jgi:hypothetical protein